MNEEKILIKRPKTTVNEQRKLFRLSLSWFLCVDNLRFGWFSITCIP